MDEKVRQLEQRIQELEEQLGGFNKTDRFTFYKLLQMLDGRNIQTGLTTGTSFGNAAAQKVSLHGATPTIQSLKINDAGNVSAGYVQAEVQAIVTAVNAIIDVLEAKGLSSAT